MVLPNFRDQGVAGDWKSAIKTSQARIVEIIPNCSPGRIIFVVPWGQDMKDQREREIQISSKEIHKESK